MKAVRCQIPAALAQAERELSTGVRISIHPDPENPRFDLYSLRVVSSRTVGACGPTPCDLEGEQARRRIVQFYFAHVYGMLIAKGLEEVAGLIGDISAAIEQEDEASDHPASEGKPD
jgi:hypothetical protein